jgi:hypothetical protein
VASMNESTGDIKGQKIVEQAYEVVERVESAYREGTALHEVEQGLFRKLLEMGYQALGWLFELHGPCDLGERVKLSDGRVVKRLAQLHDRAYQSVFGAYELQRSVYGSREGQKLEYIPLDVRLQLPKSKFSYLWQDWDPSLAVETPYAEVNEILQRILGLSVSVHSLERTNRSLAQSVASYWDNQVEVAPAQGEQLVVGTVDGKGVVIRKSAQDKANDEGHEQSSPKPACIESKAPKHPSGKKKGAILGAVYTIEPNPRTPEEVLESLFRAKDQKSSEETAQARPKPLYKHIRARRHRDEADTLGPAREEICRGLGKEYRQRNPCAAHRQILIMDGEHKLWAMGQERQLDASIIEILDLLHASSYVWKAVQALYPQRTTNEQIPRVKERIGRILRGEVHSVLRGFRWQATHEQLTDEQRDPVDKACGYLEKNAHRMRYHEYLAAGYPIASGVIEGACRHVGVDRMEGTGMRWVMQGAQSMLGLRCIHINGHWDHFMKFPIEQEQQALYPVRAANDSTFYRPMVA